jgi:hypothetical protein
MVRKVLYSDWTEAEIALELLLDDDALLAEFELDELLVPFTGLVGGRMLMMGSVRP